MTNEDTAWEQFSKADGANIGDASAVGMLQAILAEINSVKADTARLTQKIEGGAGGAPPMDGGMPPGMPPEAGGAPPMDGGMPPMEGEGIPPGPEGAPMEGEMGGGEVPPMPPAGGDMKESLLADGMLAPDVEMPSGGEDETLTALQDALSQVTDPEAISKLADILKEYVEKNYPVGGGALAEGDIPPEVILDAIAGAGEDVPVEGDMLMPEGGDATMGGDEALTEELLGALTKSDTTEIEKCDEKKAAEEPFSESPVGPAEEPGAEAPIQESDDSPADDMKPDIQINLFLGTKMDDIISSNKENGLTEDKDIDTESFKVCDNPVKKSIDDMINERMRTKSGIDGKRYKISKSATEMAREQFQTIQKSIGSFDAVKDMRVGDVLSTMQALQKCGATSIEKSYTPLIDEMVKYCDNNISPLYTAPIFKSFGIDLDKIYKPIDLSAFQKAVGRMRLQPAIMGTKASTLTPEQFEQGLKLMRLAALLSQQTSAYVPDSFGGVERLEDVLAKDTDIKATPEEKFRRYMMGNSSVVGAGMEDYFKNMSPDQLKNWMAAINGPGGGVVRNAVTRDASALRSDERNARRFRMVANELAKAFGGEAGGISTEGATRDSRIKSPGVSSAMEILADKKFNTMDDEIYALEDLLEARVAANPSGQESVDDLKLLRDLMYGGDQDDVTTRSGLPASKVYSKAGFDMNHPYALDRTSLDEKDAPRISAEDMWKKVSADKQYGKLFGKLDKDTKDSFTAYRNGEKDGRFMELLKDNPEWNAFADYLRPRFGNSLKGYSYGNKVNMDDATYGPLFRKYFDLAKKGDDEYLTLNGPTRDDVYAWDMGQIKNGNEYSDTVKGAMQNGAGAIDAYKEIMGGQLGQLEAADYIADRNNITDDEMERIATEGNLLAVAPSRSSFIDSVLSPYGFNGDEKGAETEMRANYVSNTGSYDPMIGRSRAKAIRGVWEGDDYQKYKENELKKKQQQSSDSEQTA